MKFKIVAAAVLVAALTTPQAFGQSRDDELYNVAGMLTSDRLCGTAYGSDGRYDVQVLRIALLYDLDETLVKRITIALSAKQAHDFKQSGNSLDKLCSDLWKLY